MNCVMRCSHIHNFNTQLSNTFKTLASLQQAKISPNNIKGKSVTSQKWLRRQLNDPYVEKARQESYRCRSAFKLLEMDDKQKVFKHGDVVIDCGAAPGSWSQVAVQRVNALKQYTNDPVGRVIGVDLNHMMPVPGATILAEADLLSADTQRQLEAELKGYHADVLLSDMAPNATGVRSMDHEIIIQLCYAALLFGTRVLRNGGMFICKLWQGNEQKQFEDTLHRLFTHVKIVKPQASRNDSSEVFLLAKDFKKSNVPRKNKDDIYL